MRFTKLFGAAGLLVAAALVGGTLIGSVIAAPRTDDKALPASNTAPKGAYCDAFLDAFAAELGVDRAALGPAARNAALAAIDAAVADGGIPEARAAHLRERIAAAEGDACDLVGGWGRFHPHGGPPGLNREGRGGAHLGGGLLNPAAEAMGMTPGELRRQLREGASLEDAAADAGVAYELVKNAVLDAMRERIDAAVAEGLDQARADAALERVQTWLDEGGNAAAAPHPGLGRGPGHGGGPPPWAGKDDAGND